MTDRGQTRGDRQILVVFEFPPGEAEWQLRDLGLALEAGMPGARLRYCHGFLPAYRPGGLALGRMVNGLWVHLRAFVQVLFGRDEAVLVRSAPPLIQLTVAAACRLRRIPYWVWLMDAHPEIEQALWGDRPGVGWLLARLHRLNRHWLRRARLVIVLDEAMRRRLVPELAEDRVVLCPTWGRELPADAAIDPPGGPRARPVLRFGYLGNFGLAHDRGGFERLLETCAACAKVEVVFIGTGDRAVESLTAFAARRGIGIIRKTHVPFLELPRVLRELELDFGLVALDDRFAGLVSPSKFIGYLVGGVPLVYLGPPETNAAVVCRRFGAGVVIEKTSLERTGPGGPGALLLDAGTRAAARQGIPAALRHYTGFDGRYLADEIIRRVEGPLRGTSR